MGADRDARHAWTRRAGCGGRAKARGPRCSSPWLFSTTPDRAAGRVTRTAFPCLCSDGRLFVGGCLLLQAVQIVGSALRVGGGGNSVKLVSQCMAWMDRPSHRVSHLQGHSARCLIRRCPRQGRSTDDLRQS